MTETARGKRGPSEDRVAARLRPGPQEAEPGQRRRHARQERHERALDAARREAPADHDRRIDSDGEVDPMRAAGSRAACRLRRDAAGGAS